MYVWRTNPSRWMLRRRHAWCWEIHHVRVLPVDGLSAGLRNASPPAVVAPARASLAEARARPMGLRRHERQQRSTRPAAKLGRGGGWNLEHRPELSSGSGGGGGAEDVPAFPTHMRGGDVPRAWEVRDAAAAAAASVDAPPTSRAPPPPAAPPALKAFSGKGWRRAAPGFGDPEDRDALPRAASRRSWSATSPRTSLRAWSERFSSRTATAWTSGTSPGSSARCTSRSSAPRDPS